MVMSANSISPNTELLQLLSPEQAWHYRVIPLRYDGEHLVLCIDDQMNAAEVLQELHMLLGKTLVTEPVAAEEVQRLLSTHYRRQDKASAKAQQITSADLGEDFLLTLIHEAKELGSSDIHIEPYEERARVRMRVDGMLVERYLVALKDHPGLVNKIKIRAHLDIAEKRLPQDGRIYFEHGSEKFDIRVSMLPTLYGEKVVMRLLRNDATEVDIDKLGLTDADKQSYLQGIKKPHGIILVSGPTGSGKTTTLYATLKLLNLASRNITTVEDPIEYTLEGINQVQVKENIGLSFAGALRSFLRQDPDVIMVGEIRDPETANIAIRAALTGHLVLSTIHTNSAWGTVSRLVDMGVQPFLIASTLNTSVAQRLVRVLCPHCKTKIDTSGLIFPIGFNVNSVPDQLYTSNGCEHCHYVGYKGRRAIFEVITIDQDLIEAIKNDDLDVSKLMEHKNIRSLKDQAYQLLVSGDTSLEEVFSILSN